MIAGSCFVNDGHFRVMWLYSQATHSQDTLEDELPLGVWSIREGRPKMGNMAPLSGWEIVE